MAGKTGDVNVSTQYTNMTLGASYWAEDDYVDGYYPTTITGYVANYIYLGWGEDLVVAAGDFIKLWNRYNGSTSSFDGVFKLVGWYIVYS